MDRLRHFCEERIPVLYSVDKRCWPSRRLRLELEIIRSNGQGPAFDDARRAVQLLRDQGGTCRLIGAGGCSLVSYLLGLSEIDPIADGLPFERFLMAGSTGNVQFQFTAHLPTDSLGDELQSIRGELSSSAVNIQPATPVEAMPYVLADEIRRIHPDFDLTAIPQNDQATFETLQSGKLEGIRRFDGDGAARLLSDIEPRCLADIATFTAIQIEDVHEPGMLNEFIRRGNERGQEIPEHRLELETLAGTRGVILFQEQIMHIMNRAANIPLAEAYSLIKAACKRQWEQIATFRERFVVEAVGNGMDEANAITLFEGIGNAAARVACKAHHLSEAVTTYQTAFFKTHFPREFFRILRLIQH